MRVAAGILCISCWLVPATVRSDLLVSFAPIEEGSERIVAGTVDLDAERVATIAVVGADPGRARLGAGSEGAELSLVMHDPVSRLTILRRPEGSPAGAGVERGASKGLRPGDEAFLDSGGQGEASRVVKWENTHRNKVLPLALMRVHHPGENPPRPGTALYGGAGELVAICHEGAPEFGNGTYALPVEVVARAEQSHEACGKLVRCWIGITMEAKNALPAVQAVRPDSPAVRAGLKKGDILLSVGGYDVNSYADAVNAFYYLVPGKATLVRLLRGTGKLEMTVLPEVHPAAAAGGENG